MTHEEFITAIENMTVLELNDLVKALEEKFGVSAAATDAYNLDLNGALEIVINFKCHFKNLRFVNHIYSKFYTSVMISYFFINFKTNITKTGKKIGFFSVFASYGSIHLSDSLFPP